MAKRMNVAAGEAVGFNMTPMIDCVFQLIIFFILTGQVANDAYAKDVQVIRPEDSMAIPAAVAKFPNKVTVNVVSKAAGEADPDPVRASTAGFYQINTDKFDVGKWDEMIGSSGCERESSKSSSATRGQFRPAIPVKARGSSFSKFAPMNASTGNMLRR